VKTATKYADPVLPGDVSASAPRMLVGRPPASGAVRLLRLLLVGIIIVPLGLAVAGGYYSYRSHVARSQQALSEAVAVAEENTLKVLDTYQLVAARIDDLLGGLSDQDIRAQERQLHDRLSQQIKDLPQVAAAWAIDADGHELVSARVYPVDRGLDHSGREDFQALQNLHLQIFIWALRARTLDQSDYRAYFTVARRREGPDGQFRGITIVAVSGAYFASFYNSLLANQRDYTAGIFRDDGVSLAHYPEGSKDAPPLRRDDPLARAIAGQSTDGVIVTGSAMDSDGRLVAYKRVAQYPVYVTISRSEKSVLQEWLAAMRGYLAIGGGAALALILLSLFALRRTRREQAALAHARDAVAQRALIESQLHQAQKMEAVGQLSAGIAHDFNNLLAVIEGNVALLQMRLEKSDPQLNKLISAALAGCERASRLTRRLLSFSRYQPIDARPVDANGVISSMSDLFARALGNRIRCETILANALWPILVDPNQLENSLLNLAVNARDAMGETGRLTIRTANCSIDEGDIANRPGAVAGDYVEISVSDTGCGMSDEVRERAFDPFFTTKGSSKGTGLGLSQVYGFVDAAGGHCLIDSAVGRGTTIRLFLPRHDAATSTAAAPRDIALLGEPGHGGQGTS
jgi:two-component system NtrC family sensor kinase